MGYPIEILAFIEATKVPIERALGRILRTPMLFINLGWRIDTIWTAATVF
ncbi:MAG: hypothetical protein QHC90_25215 [Shinella sp.]|nr:hypothetical protein [Shinella sp.]